MDETIEQLNKKFFDATKSITKEKLDAKQGLVTESQVLTARYLRWLHGAPDAGNPHKKYRG